MSTKQMRRLFLVALAVGLAGCATTKFTSAWRDTAYQGAPLKKIVVLGLAEETAARRVFEDTFAKALNDAGVQAVPGYTLLPEKPDRPVEQLRAAVARIHADGILVARTLRSERKTDFTPGYITAFPSMGYRGGFWGFYGSAIVSEPRAYTYDVVTIETNLWPADEGQVLWSALSETTDPANVQKVTGELAKLVIGALREQHLIPAPLK